MRVRFRLNHLLPKRRSTCGAKTGLSQTTTTLAMVLMGLMELGYLVVPELLTGVFSRHLEVVAAGVAAWRWVAAH